MTRTPGCSRVRFVLLVGLLLALAACSLATSPQDSHPTSSANTAPTLTASMPPTTPTLAPASCDARFSSAYQATLPDASFPETQVYAQVPMPPQTRTYNDDASGLRGRFLCSAGTTDAVLAFMAQHLTLLGWQLGTQVTDCGRAVIPTYGRPQCWKDGNYHLFLGINSNADWVLAFIDPAFLA